MYLLCGSSLREVSKENATRTWVIEESQGLFQSPGTAPGLRGGCQMARGSGGRRQL